MNANRRSLERKQPERLVFCKLGGEEGGSVLNLSEDGLCFGSPTPIEEKDVLQLRLSVDLTSAVEATGQLAWVDSAKRTGGLRFLELSAPAREQIRAWLSEPFAPDGRQASAVHSAHEDASEPAASGEETQRTFLRKRDEQADPGAGAAVKPVIWQELLAPSMQLIPIERHQSEKRAQFLRGVLVGLGISALVTIPVVRYSGDARPVNPAHTTSSGNRATQSSADETRASIGQPASPSASTSDPNPARTLATEPKAVKPVYAPSPTAPPQWRRPETQRASSSDPVTRAPVSVTTPRQAKAEQPFGAGQTQHLAASPAAIVPAQAASDTRPPSEQAQRPKKVSATTQQLWSAVQAGNMKAAVALADLYTRGEGVPVNCDQARVLLMVASAKKNAEAPKKLQELDKGGCPANSH
jgi:hypothetical protein